MSGSEDPTNMRHTSTPGRREAHSLAPPPVSCAARATARASAPRGTRRARALRHALPALEVVTSAQRMTMCGTAGFLPPECTASGVAAAMHSLLQSEDEEPDSGGESSASGHQLGRTRGVHWRRAHATRLCCIGTAWVLRTYRTRSGRVTGGVLRYVLL